MGLFPEGFFPEIDVWAILSQIGDLILWFLNFVWGLVLGVNSFLAEFLGIIGAWILMIFVVFMLFVLVFVRGINSTQAGIEGFSHGTMGWVAKGVGVIVVFILIYFVFSQA
ncbi:MAG: hypothetical protein NWF06_01745 [Candidatus Bathyarchaeota archaeon]|nr:hypothetical protein [Candidatus Bathyarchaeum sp.]